MSFTNLSNISIKGNVIAGGVTSGGTYTYDTHLDLYGDALISGNAFSQPSSSENMVKIEDGYCTVTGNNFIRGTVSINSYINLITNTNQIITDNKFDHATIDSSSEILVIGVDGYGSIYKDNINQTVYIPIPFSHTSTQSIGTPSTLFPNFIDGTSDGKVIIQNGYGNTQIVCSDTDNIIKYQQFINLSAALPANTLILEAKVGLCLSGAPVLNNDGNNNFYMSTSYYPVGAYSSGTGSILDVKANYDTTGFLAADIFGAVTYDIRANITPLQAATQYVIMVNNGSNPSRNFRNTKNSSLVGTVIINLSVTSGSVVLRTSPIVFKCRW